MKIGDIKVFSPRVAKENAVTKKSEQEHQNITNSNINLNDAASAHYAKIFVNEVSPVKKISEGKHSIKNYTGCLVGGAIGDALGWPVEFRRLSDIRSIYGKQGITDLVKAQRSGLVEITDDTQMTMFTADGLLKSAIKGFDENSIPDMDIVYDSYQNWYNSQSGYYHENDNGWISNIEALYENRAPGGTCLNSLGRGIAGTIEKPINDSKGCGGVMRVAPVGLMYYKNPEIAFEVGARCAALTHSNPSAYLPAGVHSSIIANLVQGVDLETAVDNSIEILKKYDGNEDTLYLLEKAKEYAKSDINSDIAIRSLGEGWTGEEAIAISVYAALKHPEDFEKALVLSVNHNGDSDSTGAITGNILGAYLGIDKIPKKWSKSVELSSELSQLALDLYNKPSDIENAKERYSIG